MATPDSAILDPDRQRSAREYARIRRRLWAVEQVASGVFLLAFLALRAGPALLSGLSARSEPPPWVAVAAVAIALGGLGTLLSLPLDYYAGFVLPHRYGLSNQTLPGWISDLLKTGLLSALIGLPMVEMLYAFLRSAGDAWWLWAGAGVLVVTVLLAAIQPVLLMPLFYKIRPLGEEFAPLVERLASLAASAGVRVQGVFTFDMSRRTKAANAALAGLGRTRRILLGDTLLEKFTADEVETVLAHELGHHMHRDIPIGILLQGALGLGVFFVAGAVLKAATARLGLDGPADPAGMPVLALTLGSLGLITLPLANAYSRWRERLADDFAVRLSHKPDAFASAMTRLANQNLAEADPERWVVWLLHSHPPLSERIARARGG